ncbi:hypothetical protein Tco_0435801 [Tanacetum coccineum]
MSLHNVTEFLVMKLCIMSLHNVTELSYSRITLTVENDITDKKSSEGKGLESKVGDVMGKKQQKIVFAIPTHKTRRSEHQGHAKPLPALNGNSFSFMKGERKARGTGSGPLLLIFWMKEVLSCHGDPWSYSSAREPGLALG